MYFNSIGFKNWFNRDNNNNKAKKPPYYYYYKNGEGYSNSGPKDHKFGNDVNFTYGCGYKFCDLAQNFCIFCG